jgi:hypothetical protein
LQFVPGHDALNYRDLWRMIILCWWHQHRHRWFLPLVAFSARN